MGATNLQRTTRGGVWELAARQHGVISRRQLVHLGFSAKAIRHRLAAGRLHRVFRGVYVVGRPELTTDGCWMAAVLACGDEAVLSHRSAAVLWGIRPMDAPGVEVTVPPGVARRREGLTVHRRELDRTERTEHRGIPATSPTCTLIDLAARLALRPLEAAVNEADKLDLVTPDDLRAALDDVPRRPGLATLRGLLDATTLTLTDSELERRFLPLARAAGLAHPQTQARVNGYRVDFYWPQLGLVVETDGLRYHRTPAQQVRDRERDQAHAARGLTALRFTHGQVIQDPRRVRTTLAAVARRLRDG